MAMEVEELVEKLVVEVALTGTYGQCTYVIGSNRLSLSSILPFSFLRSSWSSRC